MHTQYTIFNKKVKLFSPCILDSLLYKLGVLLSSHTMQEQNIKQDKKASRKKYQRVAYAIGFIIVMTFGLNIIQKSSKI